MGLEALFAKLAQTYREHFHAASRSQHSAETRVMAWEPRQLTRQPPKDITKEQWKKSLSCLFFVLVNKYREYCQQYATMCRPGPVQGCLQWGPPRRPKKRRKHGPQNIQAPSKPKTFRRYAWASLRDSQTKPNQTAKRAQQRAQPQPPRNKQGKNAKCAQKGHMERRNLREQQAPPQQSQPELPPRDMQTPDKDSIAEVDWGEK